MLKHFVQKEKAQFSKSFGAWFSAQTFGAFYFQNLKTFSPKMEFQFSMNIQYSTFCVLNYWSIYTFISLRISIIKKFEN